MEYDRVCQYEPCSKPFKAKKPHARFCPDGSCRQRQHELDRGERLPPDRVASFWERFASATRPDASSPKAAALDRVALRAKAKVEAQKVRSALKKRLAVA
jgi:hypothetical protein